MPYIIETGQREPAMAGHDWRLDPTTTTSVAVATLDEARAAAANMLVDHEGSNQRIQSIVRTISDEGGTVGPLPDGTVIEVRRITDHDYAEHRLEHLRARIDSECISWGELAELQGLAEHISPDDMQLREWAGLPEFP